MSDPRDPLEENLLVRDESHQGVEEGHEHVHLFSEAGIEEGNKPVPRWYLAVAIALGVFWVVYIALYLTGVQPNTAR